MLLIVLTPKKAVLGLNHVIWAIKRENWPRGSSFGTRKKDSTWQIKSNQIYLKHKIWKKQNRWKTRSKPNENNKYKLRVLIGLKCRKIPLTWAPKKKKNEINRIISTMCSLQHATQQETMHNNAKLSYHNNQKQLVNFMPEGSNRFGQKKVTEGVYFSRRSPQWNDLHQNCLVDDVLDEITCAKFQNEIFRGYDFAGVEFSMFLLIFKWASQ